MINEQETVINAEDNNEGFNLEDFARIAMSRWYYILISIVIALSVAIVLILKTTPTYTRSMSLLIKTEEKGGSSLTSDLQRLGLSEGKNNINNEILTMSAPVMMQEVVRRLRLDVSLYVEEGLHRVPLYEGSPVKVFLPKTAEESFASFKMKLKPNKKAELYDFVGQDGKEISKRVTVGVDGMYNTPIGAVIIQSTEDYHRHFTEKEIFVTKKSVIAVGNSYAARLSVSLVNKESSILNLSLVDDSRKRADDILFKLIDVYNESWLKDRNRVSESTYAFITDRLNTLAVELGDVDQKISDFKSSTLLPDAEAASTMFLSQSQRNNEEIFTLNNQLGLARSIRDYMSKKPESGQYLPSNTGIGSTGIEQMIGAYNTAVSERSQMVANSSESSPLVKKLDDELRLQRTAIVHSLDNLISQLQAQVNSWEKNEAATNKKLAGAPQQVKQLLSVSRQQKVKEQLYLFLLQKREESELSKTFTAWNTRVVQPPYSAGKRTPQTEMILLIAFVVGLLLPLAYLYLREALNHTVRGRADLDNMKIPLLGEIPAVIQKDHWWKPTRRTVDRGIYIKENCRDLINESFRIFRTKFDYFLAGTTPRPKVIMLTSFNPGSGKSFLSVNLAKVESLNGKRVLCIDFDFRHCSLSAIFDSPKRGITDYIVGFSDNPDELIVKGAIGEGADVLPVGIIPPNPTELLLHERVGEIITKVRDNYDLIILDCPPIDVVADANIVKQFADVTLFVIRAGLMDRRSLKEVERLYKSGSYKHTALILNGSTYIGSRYGSYRYGYSYGYSYGYNYSDGKKFKK